MKTPYRLFIRFEVNKNGKKEYRAISIPIHGVNSNVKNFVRVTVQNPKRQNLYLCKDEDFENFKPIGYWSIRSIVAKPDNLNYYIKKTLKLVEDHMKGFVVEASIKRFG